FHTGDLSPIIGTLVIQPAGVIAVELLLPLRRQHALVLSIAAATGEWRPSAAAELETDRLFLCKTVVVGAPIPVPHAQPQFFRLAGSRISSKNFVAHLKVQVAVLHKGLHALGDIHPSLSRAVIGLDYLPALRFRVAREIKRTNHQGRDPG